MKCSVSRLSMGILVAILAHSFECTWAVGPLPEVTPGLICTVEDPDFDGLVYSEKIPHCKRNVSESDKRRVAASYGNVPRPEWKNYEFDHLIPLCAGGSNDLRNIWMQPIEEALSKDKLEVQICNGLRSGTMTHETALQKVDAWITENQIY
jgi:hypothetical protein